MSFEKGTIEEGRILCKMDRSQSSINCLHFNRGSTDSPHCSLDRFAHNDCIVVCIPLQVTPPSRIYVILSDASYLLLHPPFH